MVKQQLAEKVEKEKEEKDCLMLEIAAVLQAFVAIQHYHHKQQGYTRTK